ncbi:hypothetical protein E2C01_012512 [Portunus trituberculatus]|uniref:Uncharacterized protein n=1 Tax=Portunus trituberculatus TaxID=210409 RepID=A0A5B7DEB5_PORTR|nr:hypothetical protein [Portunus trituberculatus]
MSDWSQPSGATAALQQTTLGWQCLVGSIQSSKASMKTQATGGSAGLAIIESLMPHYPQLRHAPWDA